MRGEPTLNRSPLSIHHRTDGGSQVGRGSPTGVGYCPQIGAVKNDFIQALGQQGLVGLPHRHLRSQGEEPSC